MKAALIAGALIAVATPALAAKVQLPVDIPTGATWTIESTRTRIDEREGAPRRIESKTRYRAEYRTADKATYLRLTPLEGGLFGDIPANVSAEQFKMPIDLEVDESLAPVRLNNWDELRAALFRFFDEQAAKDPGVDKRFADGVRGMFNNLSDKQAAAMMAQPITYAATGQGLALELGKSLAYEDELPSPLGGPPIRTHAAFKIDSYDKAAGRAVVVWTQTLDPTSLAVSVREGVKRLLPNSGQADNASKLKDAIGQAGMTRDERCRFEIDIRTGLATRTECAMALAITVQGKTGKRTDTWTITQSLPEKR